MGIPFFFKTIVSSYPDIYTKTKNGTCGRLFLDFNCILHQSANTIMNSNKSKKISLSEFEDLIIEDSLIYTISIIRKCNPTCLLYIGVDGLCPMAKIIQQRYRRYITVWKNDQLDDDIKEQWDRNNITPGTRFMAKFNVCINEFSKNIKAKYKVIVSDSSEFGEGEHKIMNYINDNAIDNDTTDIIYGLDADLILLGMISKNSSNIILMREESYLNIEKLKSSLILHYNQMHNMSFIRDYVVLCSLLGNDFLPSLTYMKIKHRGIDRLMCFYSTVKEELSTGLTTDKQVNFIFLAKIIELVAKTEDIEMNESIESHKKQRCRIDNCKIKTINNYPVIHKDYYNMDYNWRKNYYHSLFHRNHSHTFIQSVCKDYVDGVNFVFDYYINPKNIDHFWGYKYLYSPTAADLYSYLKLSNHEKQQNNHNNYYDYTSTMTPTLQLLIVLPPSSIKNILPKYYQNLVTSVLSGCAQYYPISFKISTFLKTYIWECYPVLPNVNIQNIAKAVKLINQTL